MTKEPDDDLKAEAADLVREAFDRARRSGKADWRRMTTAVLNNRLLQITDGEFSIGRYGARTVMEFAQLLPDLVRVDASENGGPAVVTIVEGEAPDDEPSREVSLVRAERPQVREDLWRATMDWNEAHAYVVDPVTGRARLRRETDSPELPTVSGVSKQLYKEWRFAFIEEALTSYTAEQDQAALTAWRDAPGPSRNLPTHLQDAWMDTLRARVAEHIHTWFVSAGLVVPPDLTRARRVSERPIASGPTEVAVATQRLRDLVRRCVDQMSYDELRSLQLPASVVARTFGR